MKVKKKIWFTAKEVFGKASKTKAFKDAYDKETKRLHGQANII